MLFGNLPKQILKISGQVQVDFPSGGESASPIYDDLNGKEAMELFDLNESLFSDAQVIPLRLRKEMMRVA